MERKRESRSLEQLNSTTEGRQLNPTVEVRQLNTTVEARAGEEEERRNIENDRRREEEKERRREEDKVINLLKQKKIYNIKNWFIIFLNLYLKVLFYSSKEVNFNFPVTTN